MFKTKLYLRSISLIIFFLTSFTCFSQTHTDSMTIPEMKIDSLLNEMTMAEKILQLHPEGSMNTANNKRLGIPGFQMSDGPHGVRSGLATCFPVGISMAATWDVELIKQVGVGMGKEFRDKFMHQALGPCLDIDRDPRNGRSPETGGEDPYLCAQITTALVKGIQSTSCIATLKHYNCNHRENGRTTNNIIAARRVLNEPAGLAFRTAVQQGGAMCVMNAYNLINGQYCGENPTLLTSILRTQWGFPFYVVSDWGSIHNPEFAIKAGCDICMGSNLYGDDLPSLEKSGAVPDSIINTAVRRVLRTKLFAGMLDYQPPPNPNNVNCSANQQLCLEAGRKSLVLLKNQNQILPLSKSINTVALIGPSAAVAQIDGGGSSYVTPYYTVSPKQGIESIIGASKVSFVKGCDINSQDTSGFAAAVGCAQNADIVIFCGGLDPNQEGEGGDRINGSSSLPGKQQDLINSLASANPNLVVVLFSGGICSLDRCFDSIKGLIYAFYPGQEVGNAVAQVLFGDYNPGGKLPVTMPMSDAQLPEWNDNLNDDYGCGYRWYDKMGYVPQFVFGFGLSYTTFSYSNMRITPASVAPGELVTVQVDVTNTGSRTGDEVVQLYLTHPTTSIPMPVKELKAFHRVTLDAGQTTTVEFTLTADELYYYEESSDMYEVQAGQYTVRVGGSSDNLPLSKTFEVRNDTRKPDLLITNVKMVPPYPLPGQKVIFCATVKNQGSSATIAGMPLKLVFKVDGQEVSWSDEYKSSIPNAGMALIYGTKGSNGIGTWTAGSAGAYNVEATVDPDNTIDECVETNNSATAQFEVLPSQLLNLAFNKSVTASSTHSTILKASNIVDGSMQTEWISAYSDPQWICIDLGNILPIDSIACFWNPAIGGKNYQFQLSEDSLSWTDVYSTSSGDGRVDEISFDPTRARYVRMYGTQRTTTNGYGILEFQIFSKQITSIQETNINNNPNRFALNQNYPNPFNPTTNISFSLPKRSFVSLKVFDLLGREVTTIVSEELSAGNYTRRWNAANMANGIYFYRLRAGNFIETKKLILLK